jgi:hypothetical protein
MTDELLDLNVVRELELAQVCAIPYGIAIAAQSLIQRRRVFCVHSEFQG